MLCPWGKELNTNFPDLSETDVKFGVYECLFLAVHVKEPLVVIKIVEELAENSHHPGNICYVTVLG